MKPNFDPTEAQNDMTKMLIELSREQRSRLLTAMLHAVPESTAPQRGFFDAVCWSDDLATVLRLAEEVEFRSDSAVYDSDRQFCEIDVSDLHHEDSTIALAMRIAGFRLKQNGRWTNAPANESSVSIRLGGAVE